MKKKNGWFKVKSHRTTKGHYFIDGMPIHSLKGRYDPDHSKHYPYDEKKCKNCVMILKTWSKYSNIKT